MSWRVLSRADRPLRHVLPVCKASDVGVDGAAGDAPPFSGAESDEVQVEGLHACWLPSCGSSVVREAFRFAMAAA
eukprot:12031336-Heterocapsa_arctica.AAC.1